MEESLDGVDDSSVLPETNVPSFPRAIFFFAAILEDLLNGDFENNFGGKISHLTGVVVGVFDFDVDALVDSRFDLRGLLTEN